LAKERSRSSKTATHGSPLVVAGVDLGSNSFHLLVARAEEDGRIHVLDRLRDPVRLAAGLDAKGVLTRQAIERGAAALRRFGERLRGMPASAVRAVGTNTLRKARNAAAVEERFAEALGHPIEVIAGREEARLIYSGVAHVIPETGRRLVLDIGGGSTECIIGDGFDPIVLDSLYMGCVSYTQRFFGDGQISAAAFERARLAAGLEVSSIARSYRDVGWKRAIGSSGTILAVSAVLRGLSGGDGTVTPAGLEQLEAALVAAERVERVQLPGLEPDRAAVFAGGVAILQEAMQLLQIDALTPSPAALREGLVYELLGRPTEGDPRERSIETLAKRYKVDRAQVERVERTAVALFERANPSWEHDPDTGRRLLAWAARVHEIGLSIAYSGHQKHGAYILEHADLPGFSKEEQATLAAIVGAHRRKLDRDLFESLPSDRRRLARHLTVLLRLAVRLHHSRSDEPLPELGLHAKKSKLRLELPGGWLRQRPLTRADLEEEAGYLERADFELEIEAT
jgi:exopolyphosphatase/guanosine-5'-triphosphate,3'-diphosphate pyrophosphatase